MDNVPKLPCEGCRISWTPKWLRNGLCPSCRLARKESAIAAIKKEAEAKQQVAVLHHRAYWRERDRSEGFCGQIVANQDCTFDPALVTCKRCRYAYQRTQTNGVLR